MRKIIKGLDSFFHSLFRLFTSNRFQEIIKEIFLLLKTYFIEILLLILINIFLYYYINDNVDLKKLYLNIIYSFVFIPSLLYFINLFRYIHYKRDNESINHSEIRNHHFTGIINLLLYFTTLIIFLVLFTDKPPALLIPNLKPGTFGLRAWSDSVEIKNLQVFYADSNNHWQKIPANILFNKSNWRYPEMVNITKDTSDFQIGVEFVPESGIIRLSRCAAVFYPDPKVYTRVFHNIRIRGKIKFIGVDKPEHFPGFQFITLIDTQLNHIADKPGYKDSIFFSEICLQFSLDFNDYPIPFIPDLDWRPGIINKSSNKDLKKFGSFEFPLETNKYYDISAIIYDNQALFLGHKYGSCILFEAEIDGSKNN